MLFGKRRKKDPVTISLTETQFCSIIEERSDDVTNAYCIIADASHYNLLYRDGKYLGMPAKEGGPIYPFSDTPTQKGSNGQKKRYRFAKVVCLSKGYYLKVHWGTRDPFLVVDPVTHKNYEVGANGVFYIDIDNTDASHNANMFYTKCLSQGNGELFNTEALRDFLGDSFITRAGAILQDFIQNSGRSLNDFVGLQETEKEKISKDIYPKVKDVFQDIGLSIIQVHSEGSILKGITIKEIIKH